MSGIKKAKVNGIRSVTRMKQTRAALYVRVSTGEQDTAAQERAQVNTYDAGDGYRTRSIVTKSREQSHADPVSTSC
jgi:hypothetical protein